MSIGRATRWLPALRFLTIPNRIPISAGSCCLSAYRSIRGWASGGSSSITGPFLASLLLGIADVAGKYYVPKMGPFVIYIVMIVILIWRPNGLFGRTAAR